MHLDKQQVEKNLFAGIDSSWYGFLFEQKALPYYQELLEKLTAACNSEIVYPSLNNMLRPMKELGISDIKVVIIGQDPYHTRGVADGLAFSSLLPKIPPSLKNIFKEIEDDVGVVNVSPNLENWSKQGIFLLNSILSVSEGQAKSHHNFGWQNFVLNLVKKIDDQGVIFVLWGNDAQKFEKYLSKSIIIKGAHPSPLAGGRFFNQHYFSKINEILSKQNHQPIDWRTSNEV
jgi:uracil-DNA glycosylase